jgi:hypothetical protein
MNASKKYFTALIFCTIGFVGGQLTSESPATAEVRQSAPRAAFQSGSERSLATLDVIARHLKSIDDRVARIERAVSLDNGRAAAK